jgi:hypothetical protein
VFTVANIATKNTDAQILESSRVILAIAFGEHLLGLRVPVERDHGFQSKMITQSGGT